MHCANAHFLHDVITHMPRLLFCAFIRFNLNFKDGPLLESTPWLESIFVFVCTISNIIEFQCVSFVLKKNHILIFLPYVQQIEKQRKTKSREQIQAMRKRNRKGEKTERDHKQNQKNKQDTYFRVIEWRTADVLQSVRTNSGCE